jgi:hypothetical protein
MHTTEHDNILMKCVRPAYNRQSTIHTGKRFLEISGKMGNTMFNIHISAE